LSDKNSTPFRAVITAIQGFNDYSDFFQQPAEYFIKQGIVCFAYDQRGFGASSQRGYWAGSEIHTKDLQSFVHLIKHNYPGLPVYLLGEIMGGALVIEVIREARMPKIDGVILVAPVVKSCLGIKSVCYGFCRIQCLGLI
jgi:acylglycerol lipase